jgi:phage baseplate assembly protein W
MSKLQGISVKLPLTYDPADGPYLLNKTLGETIKQNLRMLILTSPGERIMDPDFGVGMRKFLFQSVGDETFSLIVEQIKKQVADYIPVVNLKEIRFVTSDEDSTIPANQVLVAIKYSIEPYDTEDELLITSSLTT